MAGTRRLHIAYRPETDADGKVDGWIASLLDITEQSRAVQAREQLASIVESSGDAIVSKDLNGIIVSWNSAAERLFGYAAEEVVGKSITILDSGRAARRGAEDPRAHPPRRQPRPLRDHPAAQGRQPASVSLSVSPVKDVNGTIVGASKIARDISARKRNETILARRAEEQAALYQFTDRLYRAASLPDIYEAGLDAILRRSALQQPPRSCASTQADSDALRRLARPVRALSPRRGRPLAVARRRSQSRAGADRRYRRGERARSAEGRRAAGRHRRACVHSADGGRQADRQIHDLLPDAARVRARRTSTWR